ncbi:MAG TPA: hypothetical protein VHE55_12525 [Fimbriimonadaceae bacterium]|nr:hypothetical protein [Fimbriimonadaceae bacterium]
MLLTCYLAAAALFYIVVARRAPTFEESELVQMAPQPCDVVELFPATTDPSIGKAA